jgi:hypothetical protein
LPCGCFALTRLAGNSVDQFGLIHVGCSSVIR